MRSPQPLAVMAAIALSIGISHRRALAAPSLPTSEPDFPTTQLRWWNWNDASAQPWQPIDLTVPDQDTTQSAYGGILRRYDVHVAKMFEVSHYYCQQNEAIEGFRWNYEAANGNVFMGRFDISCHLAKDIATAYGLQRTEHTEVSFGDIQPDETRENPYGRDYEIPVLNISTNAKIQKWRQYVQTFTPFFSEATRKANSETRPFPVAEVLPQIEGNVRIPILIPSAMPNVPALFKLIEQFGLCADTDPDGYGYTFELGPCVSRPTWRGFDRLSARSIDHLPEHLSRNSEPHIGPKDTLRDVELAHGVIGTFHTSCGPYCVSSLTWDYKGVRYSIWGRFGAQVFFVRTANSAIEAGDRSPQL